MSSKKGTFVQETRSDPIVGCLRGIAVGDAIGKQTETLSRRDVLRWYPDGIRGFEGVPGTIIPRYAGNRKREWRIGETTDDTERTIAVARAIIEDGAVRHASVGRELLTCLKCVHPGLESLWEFHQAGDPERLADRHDGCGAAVRVAPVGIIFRSARLEAIVDGAWHAAIPTHGGPLALAGAAATAAAVSAAIDGVAADDLVALAARAAAEGECRRSGTSDAAFARRLTAIHSDLCRRSRIDADSIAADYFPDNPLTIVPLAISLAALMDAADAAILLAANIGGDSDSVASIAGGILGARFPDTVNRTWIQTVEAVNGLDLDALAADLARLRR